MVQLVKMSMQDYESYIGNAIGEYAGEKVKAGTWAEEEAMQLSRETFQRLLPEGIDTPSQYLFTITDMNTNLKIGVLWFHLREKFSSREAFIYDFLLFEEFRGKGYGTQAMRALEQVAQALDINKLSLHVFGHNERAFHLYKKMGYEVTDISMSKYI